jgi:hypothetical protein
MTFRGNVRETLLGETQLGETLLGETSLGETSLGESALYQTSRFPIHTNYHWDTQTYSYYFCTSDITVTRPQVLLFFRCKFVSQSYFRKKTSSFQPKLKVSKVQMELVLAFTWRRTIWTRNRRSCAKISFFSERVHMISENLEPILRPLNLKRWRWSRLERFFNAQEKNLFKIA